jgi:hypothetical protein
MFVRRAAGGNEMNLVEMETALRGARDGQVSNVNGIKRSAKDGNPALARRTSGSAVSARLGDAQRSSV